jgi:transcription antitermination factor NusG
MSQEDDDVREIVNQLQRLQIRQATLLTRLERLSQQGQASNETGQTTGPASRQTGQTTGPAFRQTPRAFQIGDRVQIRNPGPFQPNKGTIQKIGPSRITVVATNGTKILRAPKNLFRINIANDE